MTTISDSGTSPELTFNQRWNSLLVIILAGAMFVFGLTMRSSALNATIVFEDLESGIRAQVPAGWLIDSESPDYVFRAIDPDALPYKTQLEVAIIAVGQDMTPNLVLNLLTQQRSPNVAAYREISRTTTTLRDDTATRMTYTYTDFERNPFLQSEGMTVKAVDVVVLQRGQAVILTYREASTDFDANLYRFEQFLQTVEIF